MTPPTHVPPVPEPFEPVDADVRRRAAGLDAADRRGPLLVEAAAGTGKTTVLIERVLNLVRSGDQPLARIAVVTFTEAAAAELKQRLRDRVATLLAGADSEVQGDERARLRRALSDLETAAVGTIHSFCMELLKQRPIEAGVDPGFKVADLFQQRILKARAWEAMLRGMRPNDPGLEAAHDLDLAHEPDLRRIAFQLVEVDRARLPRPDPRALADWPRAWDEIGASLDRALRQATAGGALAKGVGAALESFEQLAPLAPREQQRAVLAGELKILRRGGTKKEEEAKAARAEAHAQLEELSAGVVHERLAELGQWLSGLGEIYRQLAEREGWLDFDGLIRRALTTLQTQPHVLADFRRRYPALLVDEFQDTDPLQTELLLLLADPSGPSEGEKVSGPRSLFLVGDPKQSIYRFRGADLENYNRVLSDALGPERQVVLRQSFRPLPAVAAWVNQVMARVMSPAAGSESTGTEAAAESDARPTPLATTVAAPGAASGEPTVASYEAPYRELVARQPRAVPKLGGVLYLEIEFPTGGASDGGGVEASREEEAEAWAKAIHRLVAAGEGQVRDRLSGELRPASYGDVALLLPKLTVLDTYERVFHHRGIPFRVIGGRHYYRRDEVHALLSILRALADPGDPVAVVSALRGPGFGVSDAALAAWALCRPRPRFEAAPGVTRPDPATSPDPRRAAALSADLDLLRDLYQETLGLPLPELVEAVLDRTGLVPFFALQWRGEQRVANLRKVVEVARRVEAAGVAALSAFIRWLEGLLEEEPEESDSPYLEGAGAAVRLTTVHRAKGLEFPIVFLGGLPSGAGRGGGRLRVLECDDGRLALALSSRRATRGADEASARERLREVAETKRLLYVATTRARDLLVLPLPSAAGVRQGDLFQALYAEDAGHPVSLTVPHHRWVADQLPAPPEHEGGSRIDPGLLTRSAARSESGARRLRRRQEDLARAAQGTAGGPLRPSDEEALPEPELSGAGMVGSQESRRAAFRIGDAAHLLLEAELAGHSTAAARLSPRLTPAEEATARELAARFRGTALDRRARAAGPDRCFAELTVTLALPDDENGAAGPAPDPRILDGKIDLAFEEPDGWVIVDFKTDRLEPGGGSGPRPRLPGPDRPLRPGPGDHRRQPGQRGPPGLSGQWRGGHLDRRGVGSPCADLIRTVRPLPVPAAGSP